MRKCHVPLIAAGIAAVMLSGCTTVTGGEPVASDELTTSTVAPRTPTKAPRTTKPVARSVARIIKDIELFWARGGIHLDVGSRVDDTPTCVDANGKTWRYLDSPAVYCFDENLISYRPTLPSMPDAVKILAHEMGHAVQDDANWFDGPDGDVKVPGTDIAVREVSADCLGGVYIGAEEPSLAGTDVDGIGGVRTKAFQKGNRLNLSDAETCFTEYER